ncbi:MAG: peptide-binding protein [Acidobacteriota bacterium]
MLVAALAGLVACGESTAPEPTRPLFAYLPSEPASLNFVAAGDSSTRWISKLICETLVAFDHDLNVVPLLALSWDASADGRVVTFHLRTDVRWQDGVPFTAKDVVFTLQKVLDPASLATGKRVYFDNVVSSVAVDDHTVRIERNQPYARAIDVWEALPILPEHLYAGVDFLAAPINRHPVGTGPYRFVSWDAGSRIELAANPDYHGPSPSIDRIVFRPLPDPSTRVAALLAGELDLTSLRPADRSRILSHADLAARVRVIEQETLYVRYVAWNLDGSRPFFTDRRVRRAMTEALDRRGYLDHVLMGAGSIATSFVHPSMWGFDAGIEPWPYDRADAARLLDDAGWLDHDGDGQRDRNGRPFAFTLLVPAGNDEAERLAALWQESLRTLGVTMKIRRAEFNLFLRLRGDRDFDAYLGGWRLDPDPDCYDFWHSSQIGGDGLNYSAYRDPEVDRLCDEARQVLDRDRRAAAYQRVQRILHRDQPATFVVYRRSLIGVSRRLQGVRSSPLGMWNWRPGPLEWSLDGVGPDAERAGRASN